jgi:hypothetical protein
VNTRLQHLAELLGHLFGLTLWLYPARRRQAYGAEMQAVFRLNAVEAAQHSAGRLLLMAVREAHDLPGAIFMAHWHTMRGLMNPIFPDTSDRSAWPAALLSLLPFLLGGPLRILISYQADWSPRQGSELYLAYLGLCALTAGVGLGLGALKKFPRWAYPYPIYMASSLYLLTTYAISRTNLPITGLNSFFVSLGLILLALGLPGLRWFYRRIPQDWTLLTYGLFGLVLYLLSSIDFDESPSPSLLVVLPGLISLAAALAHLRIRSALLRVGVLLAGTFAGLFVWLIPIYLGMVSALAGLAIGTLMLMVYGVILTAILLAPMAGWLAVRTWRAKRTMH